ncbi:DUF2147 domain-containing protein [Verrucomicrobiaceae bacterium R5-34]|nr:DUF2147 domain-containing protein [Verrucomicrobiaceae bacterium R5-34]
MRLPLMFLTVLLLCSSQSWAADPIEGEWLKGDGSARIKIKVNDKGQLTGALSYVRDPKRRHDSNNPDVSKRKRPLLGLVIIRGFTKKGQMWQGGTVYDSSSGKTYQGKIWLDQGKLIMRGYIGVSLIGRTSSWTRHK